MLKALVVYHNNRYPLRASIRDHLFALGRHGNCEASYLNLATTPVAREIAKFPFDLIVFHTTFLSLRWNIPAFEAAIRACRELKNVTAVKVGLPQDEFIHTVPLVEFINEFGLAHVFSVAPSSEWPKIYVGVNPHVQFHKVLTGYLEPRTIRRIERLRRRAKPRDIDIGYRAWRAEPWLGRHGLLKARIADLFQRDGVARGLSVDISTEERDTLFGDDWFRFLLRCRYTVGVEGGASLLDASGSIQARTVAYTRQHPNATFEEIERSCFPGMDGSLRLFALSPRHLEACATRTCQVLVRGSFDGVLRPGDHYISLEPDFSNIDQVLEDIALDGRRESIVETAYRDVVASGRYSYRSFARQIIAVAAKPRPRQSSLSWSAIATTRRINTRHSFDQARLAFHWRVLSPTARVVRPMARRIVGERLRRLLRKLREP